MATPMVVIPGQVIGSTSNNIAGPGTHVYENKIYASIPGPVLTIPPSASTTSTSTKTPGGKPTLTVSRGSTDPAPQQTHTPLPVVGSVVLCTVTRVQVRQALCLILAIVPPLTTTTPIFFQPSESLNFPALLRREDIRLTEKDRVVMNDSVRVGDLIRAQVISIGDERQYYIGTAGNEFGVLAAKAEGNDDGVHEGGWMTSVSWKEMRDLGNGTDGTSKGEARKVAKPV